MEHCPTSLLSTSPDITGSSVREAMQLLEAKLREAQPVESKKRAAARKLELKQRVVRVLCGDEDSQLKAIDLTIDGQFDSNVHWFPGDPSGRLCFWFCMAKMVCCVRPLSST
jgi:hypothetical protein